MRRPIAVEVETGLADGHGPLVPEELRQLDEPFRLRPARLVRMDPERGEYTGLALRDRE